MDFIHIWAGYQRVGRLPEARWRANGFGVGPVEGDKSPHTSCWPSHLVAGHFVEINVSVLWALLPPNTLNSLTAQKCAGWVCSFLSHRWSLNTASSFWITISVPMRAIFMLC